MRKRLVLRALAAIFPIAFLAAGQDHVPAQRQPATRGDQPPEDAAEVARGKALFQSTCGFCHGADATGSRAPDLVRSPVTMRDENGSALGPVIRNGRPDKGMPSFATLKDDQVASIVAFLHHQANEARHSSHVPGDYPLAKLLTGNAAAGKQYFEGAGGCTGCHSATGDLAGVANKYSPINLQQEMVYPSKKDVVRTATIQTAEGIKYNGKLIHDDEFNISVVGEDGWIRTFARSEVKAEIHDPLSAHRELTPKYSDADIHNLFAYLETLK